MAVANRPNVRYVLESVKADLEGIKRAAGHWLDVSAVVIPPYPPDHPLMFEADSGSLHLWCMSSGVGDSLMGETRRDLILWIGGVLKANDSLQQALLEFAESVRGVMLANPMRTYPGSAATNTYGVTTIEDQDGVSFMTTVRDGGLGIGVFLSKWRIEYVYALPVG